MVVEGIRSLLQNEKNVEWTGHAMNADSCLAFLRQQQPDIILMDINLPDKSGIDLCKEVKEAYPQIFIIGLSTFNQQSFIQQELMEAIEMVVKGKTYLSDEVSRSLRRNEDDTIPVLTRREKEVLVLIAEGMTNNEIAEKIFISASTVDTHRKNLLAKMPARNSAELVKLAFYHKLIIII